MANKDNKEVCQAAHQIQDILSRKNLELVVWPNVSQEKCIWVIQKGKNPWEGARVAVIRSTNNAPF